MTELSGSNELQIQLADVTVVAVPDEAGLSDEVQPREEVGPPPVVVQIPAVLNLLDATGGFAIDFEMMEMKMHRFPLSLGSNHHQYIVPMAVAIGPYHHGSDHLDEMEKVKHVMAGHFIRSSRCSLQVLYEAVHSVVGDARNLYTENPVKGMSDDDFAAMMFRDACFLLEYKNMLKHRETTSGHYASSDHALFSNGALVAQINNDIMLLENQLPWLVIEKLGRTACPQVEHFISQFSFGTSVLDVRYKPPHLLGLFLQSVSSAMPPPLPDGAMRVSVPSAMELAEIGIKLKASNTPEFLDMGFKEGHVFSEIFLEPLNLDVLMSSRLVNMAAFEVCMATASRFREKKTDVCSYLRLLAMLMAREEDVHELRKKGLVQGALTNQQTLKFFKGITEHMYDNPRYACILREIEVYKCKRWMWIKLHKFLYNNKKIIASVLSIIGVLVGIFKTLYDLKKRQQ